METMPLARLSLSSPSRAAWLLASFVVGACAERPPKPPVPNDLMDGGSTSGDAGPPPIDFGFFIPDAPLPVDVRVEAGPDAPPLPTGPVCGDGKVELPETCDDGNGTPGRRLLGRLHHRAQLHLSRRRARPASR